MVGLFKLFHSGARTFSSATREENNDNKDNYNNVKNGNNYDDDNNNVKIMTIITMIHSCFLLINYAQK